MKRPYWASCPVIKWLLRPSGFKVNAWSHLDFLNLPKKTNLKIWTLIIYAMKLTGAYLGGRTNLEMYLLKPSL